MKTLAAITGTVMVVWLLFYLYQRQLGAISFLSLAVILLILSYRQWHKKDKKEQER